MNAFSRLAPFIQEYIYNNGWTELRAVQIEACRVIFETDDHLLIAAATASGKTEAAFLPVVTLLHEKPATSIGALYIGPIKALINDQFDRLNDLLKQAEIPVCAWHGDVLRSRKEMLLKNPQGILQITPESLESLLINKKTTELTRLFGDLRFIIIDEIHAFMGTERGCQVLSQLARLSKFVKKPPRRIGLSATLGDYSSAEDWLRSETERSVITANISDKQRKVHLALEHFYIQKPGFSEKPGFCDSPHYKYIFNITKSRKCLIFTNDRAETESVITNLRQIASDEGLPDIYHVHHGSISAKLREAAEEAMREPNTPAITAATITLELGIDIGQLERVIQLDAPFSVSSFLQRLGRTGRRGDPADMRFVCTENEPSGEESLPNQIPWQLLQCIAIIQVYLEERWIEPIRPVQYPLSLLYHQTMSILTATGEISPAYLADRVLTLPPFIAISKDDFRQFLRYLIDLDHLEQTEQGELVIGSAAEKMVRSFQFYAVFAEQKEYIVRDDSMEIGSIIMPPPVGGKFTLAGRTWEVLDIEPKAKTLWVKQVEGIASIAWRGRNSANIHTGILQRMRRVLFEDIEYSYLQNGAKERLKAARQLARNAGLDRSNILSLEGKSCCIFPWMGTVAFRTLERWLNLFGRESLDIRSISGSPPYFLTVKCGQSKPEDIGEAILSLCKQGIRAEDLVNAQEAPKLQKYDEFIPPNLLRKAFAVDYLDVAELRTIVSGW
ncbi:DEAD/DEAH box helicase [Argonema antarcticum]|uniref:DEAD/DEAH box helicase n=1 Tax=Argonema antarcticum TaxID=2942763 RepID=UPI002011E603|nr:DEAD/DEAH box helicase [Argonema antarcticum]MCL1473083.1 DEAD/DEAH box helicase [Argonema antarcticum A004/B2]